MEAIFACTTNGAFGKTGSMPWSSIKEDFANFRSVTMNKTLAVAKNTMATLPPLDGRTMALIGREDTIPDDAIIIGGLSILTVDNLKKCEIIWFTHVHGAFEADTYLSNEVLEYIQSRLTTEQIVRATTKCTIYKLME